MDLDGEAVTSSSSSKVHTPGSRSSFPGAHTTGTMEGSAGAQGWVASGTYVTLHVAVSSAEVGAVAKPLPGRCARDDP